MVKEKMAKLLRNERGQALILVLGFLAIGGLTITPLLVHMDGGLNATRIHRQKAVHFSSADAGIEHASWRLLHESGFFESMTPENPTVEYTINVNGEDVLIKVTRLSGLGENALSLDVNYVIPAGHQLELRVTVYDDDHCHFAYDTGAYASWLQVPTTSDTLTYYLHNNPTPPTGDTDAQPDLTMDEVQPTASTLYNYDQNYDGNVGRRIEESEGGPDGLELKEYQNWLTAPYGSDTHLQGTALMNLYVAPDGFNYENEGAFTAYLRDYDPAAGTYTEITSGTYEIEEDQWVKPWHSTAPEGKYRIQATADNTQLTAFVALGFGYLNTLSFEHG